MSDFRWSVDSLVVHEGVVFCFGWLFHSEFEVLNLQLVVKSSDDMGEHIISADHGGCRIDVEKAFLEHDMAKNAGYVIYGRIESESQEWSKAYLSGALSNGGEFKFNIPLDSIVKGESEAEFKKRIIRSHREGLVKRGVQLLRQGQFSELYRKASYHFASRNKSSLLDAKKVAKMLTRSEKENVVLIFDHMLGGGANQYSERLIADLVERGATILVLSYKVHTLSYVIDLKNKRVSGSYAVAGVEIVSEIADFIKFKKVVYNTAVSFPQPERVPQLIASLKKKGHPRVIIMAHDFFLACPSHFLLNDSGKYCGIPDEKTCRKCLSKNQQGFSTLFAPRDITLWRNYWREAISLADEIRVFSFNTKGLLVRAYPEIDVAKISVIPHKVEYVAAEAVNILPNYSMHIGVVGQIGRHKGAYIIQALAEEIKRRGIDVKITVIGAVEVCCDSSVVKQTGRYSHKELPGLIRSSGANVMFFSSIWPETFSYVVQELIEMELPVACFDMGAPGERVSEYLKGLIIKSQEIPEVLDALVRFHKELYFNN